MPLDPSVMRWIARIESGGNPSARTGSYKGLYQLSDQEFNRYGGGDIYNPDDNRRAFQAKVSDESDAFRRQYGRDPNGFELYMTHQQGPGGYAAHTSNPDAPAWQNMASTAEGRQKGAGWARQAIWGNVPDDVKAQFPGGVDSLTSRQFMDLWKNKIDRFSGDPNAPMAYAGGPAQPPQGLEYFTPEPQGDANQEVANNMWRAASALMSINNPRGAAVLASNVKQLTPKSPAFDMQIGPNGEIVVLDKNKGTSSLQGTLGRKVDESALKQQTEQLDQATKLHSTSLQADQFAKKIDNGELDLRWMQWPRAKVESALGMSSPQTQNYNAFQSFRQDAVQSILQAAKGTQTEGDAQRAASQFTEGVASGDNATVKNALEKLVKINEQLIGSRRTSFDATSKAYKDNPAFEPFRQKYDEMGSFYSGRNKPTAGAGGTKTKTGINWSVER